MSVSSAAVTYAGLTSVATYYVCSHLPLEGTAMLTVTRAKEHTSRV